MSSADFLACGLIVLAMLLPGFVIAKRGSRTTGTFILGGRKLPWWLGGAAMVASGTNADSALHQSGKIRREGLTGAWFYWSQLLGYVWHSLVFSRLWRRLGINTVVEFYGVRYSGRAATLGRIWSMVFASLIESTVGLALGLLAMIKIVDSLFSVQPAATIAGIHVSTSLCIAGGSVALGISYSMVAGLLGVVAGDMVEFVVALVCSYLLMFFAYRAVGYAHGLRSGLAHMGRGQFLKFDPTWGFSLAVLFVIQPLATLAGNNTLNQRFLAMRDERQAMFSGIWRVVSAYFLRTWPWYICGLASLILLPNLAGESEMAYPRMIVECLPSGIRGMMLGSLIVTFMGAVGTLMHNFGSVFVNDFYRIFIRPRATEQHYVWVIRAAMLTTAAAATAIALASHQILSLLEILITLSAASGFAMLLRWHWWRVNGWADFAAQALALPVTLFYAWGPGHALVRWLAVCLRATKADGMYAVAFVMTIGTVTFLWVMVMLLTPPEPRETLVAFYAKVRPYGFWRPIAQHCPGCVIDDRFARDLFRYALALALSFGILFGLGLILLGFEGYGMISLAIGGACGWHLIQTINRDAAVARLPASIPHVPVQTRREEWARR